MAQDACAGGVSAGVARRADALRYPFFAFYPGYHFIQVILCVTQFIKLLGFQEWHTDQLFVPVCPSLTALYCKQAGGASTAFASGVTGLRDLPEGLRAQAEAAVCQYTDTDTGKKCLLRGMYMCQNRPKDRRKLNALGDIYLHWRRYGKVDGSETITGVQHRMVQRHPHTGERESCLSSFLCDCVMFGRTNAEVALFLRFHRE